jgi:hypothetical protein
MPNSIQYSAFMIKAVEVVVDIEDKYSEQKSVKR